jgi:hypothetical protein
MRLKKGVWIWMLCLLLLPALAVHAQEEQWLQYRHTREASEITGEYCSQTVKIIKTKPVDVSLPKFINEKPVFAKWNTPMVETGFVWIALDRTNASGRYNRLYVDTDCDGDLSDEKAVEPYRTSSSESYFGSVKLVFKGEDGPLTYHADMRYYSRENYQSFSVYSGCWYEGTISISGKELYCMLVDKNANGAFNDAALGNADFISISKLKAQPKYRFAGTYFEWSKGLYNLEIAQDGAFVVFDKAQNVPMGMVQLPETITAFGVGGPLGQFDRVPKQGRVSLPVGAYRIEHWGISRKDKKGHTWLAEGRYFGSKGKFKVTADKPYELTIGEPLISSLEVDRDDRKYSINQSLVGFWGERISITRNNSRAKAPRLHIKNNAEYDRTFNFEYG